MFKKPNRKKGIALLHCVTAYPVEYQYANLKAIETLRNNFDVVVGYSDHTLGVNAAISSVSLGARIIEKHFTRIKTNLNFVIIKFPLIRMNFFFKMVKSIRDVELMLGKW